MKTKVKIYSTHLCPYCVLAKNFLKEHNIEFEEIFVDDDHEKAKEMIKKSGQTGVPVIEINNEIIIGFNKEKIKQLLKIE